MKKTSIDFILSILCIVGYLFTGFYAFCFVGGLFFGDFLIAKYNWFPDEESVEQESWASQFQINSEQDQNQIEE
jgi:hypothetical protein